MFSSRDSPPTVSNFLEGALVPSDQTWITPSCSIIGDILKLHGSNFQFGDGLSLKPVELEGGDYHILRPVVTAGDHLIWSAGGTRRSLLIDKKSCDNILEHRGSSRLTNVEFVRSLFPNRSHVFRRLEDAQIKKYGEVSDVISLQECLQLRIGNCLPAAVAAQLIAQDKGIMSYLMCGSINDGVHTIDHAWNIMFLHDKWCIVDVFGCDYLIEIKGCAVINGDPEIFHCGKRTGRKYYFF